MERVRNDDDDDDDDDDATYQSSSPFPGSHRDPYLLISPK